MMIGRGLCALAVAMLAGGAVSADIRLLDFADLRGWSSDDHAVGLKVFQQTCGDLDSGDWSAVCALSYKADDARVFFETFFRPVMITDGEPPLFTGYFEPELEGSKTRTDRFQVPLYRQPDELASGDQWISREEIETSGVLEGRGLEIAWIEDPVDKFFLQIQGSGRIRLESGNQIRIGYGGKNGHPYRSVGQELVRRGIFQEHQVSADVIRSWVKKHPDEGKALLHHNPSYVFFREVSQVPADKGPLGAMNRSITAGRTVAIDPEFIPLGAPIWLEKGGKNPIRRLMVGQDTGSAIRGPQRADVFFGTGPEAGRMAGKVRDGGRMVVLLPINDALAMVEGK